MALIVKKIADIFTEVKDSLQDQQGTRWTEQELFRYLDQAVRNVALATRYNKITDKIHVADPLQAGLTDSFTLSLEAIEFYKVESKQPYEIVDARTIKFPENTEEEITVEYYAFPPRVIYGAMTELSLDEDLYDAVKFFILYRAYQKEASTENIQKATYFKSEYSGQITLNLARWHSKFDVASSRTEYFV